MGFPDAIFFYTWYSRITLSIFQYVKRAFSLLNIQWNFIYAQPFLYIIQFHIETVGKLSHNIHVELNDKEESIAVGFVNWVNT